jgi:hypothetical protein
MKKIAIIFTFVLCNVLHAQTTYSNDKYGFTAVVPKDWLIYAEIKDDAENHVALLDWGLPKIYSDVEKQNIENAVSITAYQRSDIKNIDDLMKFEFDRISSIMVSKTKLDDILHTSYEIISKRNNQSYKTKTTFVFKNNIGYVLIFTATPGTYDKNLPKFNDFITHVVFSAPVEKTTPQTTSGTQVRFDGLYIAKTKSMKIGDNQIDIYSYIRFYSDGQVYTQAVNSYSPEKVIKWFGKNGRFERSGNYKLTGSAIEFTVTNNASEDKNLEGPMKDSYNGKVTDENKLFLQIKYNDATTKDFWFEFVKAE